MLAMVDSAVMGYKPFFPVRLVVFPEFAHAAPVYATARELRDKLAVELPCEHTDRYEKKARELGIYIQTGSFIERDPDWPGVVFNTTCLVGPEGILYKYRKVNPWLPWEVHASPHDLHAIDGGRADRRVHGTRPGQDISEPLTPWESQILFDARRVEVCVEQEHLSTWQLSEGEP